MPFNHCHELFGGWTFKAALKALKKQLAPAFPVTVKIVPEMIRRNDEFGWCDLVERKGRRRFIIAVDASICEDMAVETLFHEWGHAISWVESNGLGWLKDHGPEFGVAKARVECVQYGEKFA